MIDLILVGIVVIIVGLAIFYLYKEKKRGARCVGCSDSGCCSSQSKEQQSCSCCHSAAKDKQV